MKTIRASVSVEGHVELLFGFDRELVDLVKVVSGFSWDKVSKKWSGSTHALAALSFAGAKCGVNVAVSHPLIMMPPTVIESDRFKLRDYQKWAAGVLSQRREFLLCWSPRTGKTTTTLHAIATQLATLGAARAIVIPPAGVVSEWSRQLDQCFPGMKFFEIEGQPLESERRLAAFEKTLETARGRARLKAIEKFEKPWKKNFKKLNGRDATSEEVSGAITAIPQSVFAEAEAVAVEKLVGKRGAAVAEQKNDVVAMTGAHIVACQHDLVSIHAETLDRLADLAPFVLVIDEIQQFANSRAPRSKALVKLSKHHNCKKVWTLSGTPMRNRPEDLVVFYDVMGGVGAGPWPFLKRYASAHEGEFGWTTGEPVNLDELAARLASVSHRLTREDVKSDLAPIDRKITLCPLTREEGQRYQALEGALGKTALAGRGAEASAALKTLTGAVLQTKLRMALERVVEHVGHRGKKILVGANFHESLKEFERAMRTIYPGAPLYVAGGWLSPDKRAAVVEAWKKDPVPAPLLVNVLSSGVGIDLSDADGTVILEIPWVPSDAMQFEARILDVHQGKRTTDPWVEYLLAAGTVDEDMAVANLRKIAVIDEVVGSERESRGLARALRESGVVSQVDLGLESKDDDAVEAALEGLRRRLSGEIDASTVGTGFVSVGAVLGAVEEGFDDETEDNEEKEYNG